MKRSASNLGTIFTLVTGLAVWAGSVPASAPESGTADVSVSWSKLILGSSHSLGRIQARVSLTPLAAPVAEDQRYLSAHPHQELFELAVHIEATTLAGKRSWEGRTKFIAPSGAATERVRFKPGRDGSVRRYRYTVDGVHRTRTEPKNAKEARLEAEKWSQIRHSFYPYGESKSACPEVSDPLVLLYLASIHECSGEDPIRLCVFNKKTLFSAELRTVGRERIQLDYRSINARGDQMQSRQIDALKLNITAIPLALASEKTEEFEFLGFSGPVEIMVEAATGIPVSVSGQVPKLGKTRLTLTEMIE